METMQHNKRLLYVDDEENLLSSFRSLMRKEDVDVYLLKESTAIVDMLKTNGPFAVVISDQRMPEMQGVEVLQAVWEAHPDTIRILMTGFSDMTSTIRAINEGKIARYVGKPWQDDDLRAIVHEAITHYNLQKENEFLVERLRERNANLKEVLDGTVRETIRILGDLLGHVNPTAGAWSQRIKRLGLTALSIMPDVDERERWEISCAFDLFSFGLAIQPVTVQAAITKIGMSALERFPAAKNHHLVAATILDSIPRFKGVANIVRLQEKDFNGIGDPVELHVEGKDIPLGARILHILLGLERETTPGFKGREVLDRMSKEPHRYDVDIIKLILGYRRTSTGERVLTVTRAEDLNPGMVLQDDIITKSGQMLLKRNFAITASSVSIVLEWQLHDPVCFPVSVIVPD